MIVTALAEIDVKRLLPFVQFGSIDVRVKIRIRGVGQIDYIECDTVEDAAAVLRRVIADAMQHKQIGCADQQLGATPTVP